MLRFFFIADMLHDVLLTTTAHLSCVGTKTARPLAKVGRLAFAASQFAVSALRGSGDRLAWFPIIDLPAQVQHRDQQLMYNFIIRPMLRFRPEIFAGDLK
jgi:hypothetical protein